MTDYMTIEIQQCALCQEDVSSLIALNCIEQPIKICKNCIQIINSTLRMSLGKSLRKIGFDIQLYNKMVTINRGLFIEFYKLNRQQCNICYELKICCKMCSNEHYFCLECSKSYIESRLHQKTMKCPQDNCDQFIDFYIQTLFIDREDFEQWAAFSLNMLCPNENCKSFIHIFPKKQPITQILKVHNEYSQCMNCKIKICDLCWTELKGSLIQHKKICNTKEYFEKLDIQYLKQNGIIECPSCHFYSMNTCQQKNKQILECQICYKKFCFFCKSGELQLFSKKDNNTDLHQCFNCYKKFYNWQVVEKFICILSIPLIILFFLLQPIVLVCEAGKRVTKFIKVKFLWMDDRKKRYVYLTCWPIIIVLKILAYFFKYAIKMVLFVYDSLEKYTNYRDDYYNTLQ